MESFKTKDQSKSNLVGDAKLMSDAVDVEQELIRVKRESREIQIEYYKLVKANIKTDKERLALIDEVRELKRQLEADRIMYAVNIAEMTFKSQAWDDLMELVNHSYAGLFDITIHRSILWVKGHMYTRINPEAVSNALASIRGES